MHTHIPIHEHRETKSSCLDFLYCSPPLLLLKLNLALLATLAGQQALWIGLSPVHNPGVRGTCLALHGHWGLEVGVLCLHSKYSYPLSHLSNLYLLFLMVMMIRQTTFENEDWRESSVGGAFAQQEQSPGLPLPNINQVSCCLSAGPALMRQMQDGQFQVILAIHLL